MKNLIKYEFRKTWTSKAIILAIAAVAEIAFLLTLYLDDERSNALSIILLTMLAFGGVLFIGIQSIMTMHQDMNTKQGYMLYMTPNSCYKILGGKVIENGLSMFLAGAFFFALGALDVTLLFGHHGELRQLQQMFSEIMESLRMEFTFDTATMIALTVNFLFTWLSMVMTAYLADVVSVCLLAGKRYNGWVSLLLFLLLSWLVSFIQQTVTSSMTLSPALLYTDAAVAAVCSVVMYFVTAFLMDKRLSV